VSAETPNYTCGHEGHSATRIEEGRIPTSHEFAEAGHTKRDLRGQGREGRRRVPTSECNYGSANLHRLLTQRLRMGRNAEPLARVPLVLPWGGPCSITAPLGSLQTVDTNGKKEKNKKGKKITSHKTLLQCIPAECRTGHESILFRAVVKK